MTSRNECALAETLAGAIAIGEAGEAERETYRAHLSGCARCLDELGGEREIERVMLVAARARDDERWEPDVRKALVRSRGSGRAWKWGAALAVGVIVVGSAISLERQTQVVPTQHAISAHEARAIASLGTQSAPRREGRAESLVVGSAPPVTTSFSLSVDGSGTPLRCTVTKSSGDPDLDAAVCRAVLHARYKQR
jgi:hypothetical protein